MAHRYASTRLGATIVKDAWNLNGAARKRVSDLVRARHEPCVICREPIDYSLHYPNPLSFSVQHMAPRSVRPDLIFDPSNCRAAHLVCNTSLGTDVVVSQWETSRCW